MNQPDFPDLETLRGADVHTADPDTLTDIRDVKIDINNPPRERMLEYIRQIKNPYCFRCGNMTVKVSYADTEITMEECLEEYFKYL